MGGRPLTAMNICCFPVKTLPFETLREILRGGADKVHEAGAALAGGHSVEDEDLKYGLSVTGVVHPDRVVTNAGLRPGQILVLTKPLGTGVIATALKAGLASPQAVERAVAQMRRLNALAGRVMNECGVGGGTDVTGFGLLGHGLELARASGVGLEIIANDVPVLPEAREMATMGLVPLGSHRNRQYCDRWLASRGAVDPIVRDLLADAQTSGGLLMGLEPDQLDRAVAMLLAGGDGAAIIGRVTAEPAGVVTVVY